MGGGGYPGDLVTYTLYARNFSDLSPMVPPQIVSEIKFSTRFNRSFGMQIKQKCSMVGKTVFFSVSKGFYCILRPDQIS